MDALPDTNGTKSRLVSGSTSKVHSVVAGRTNGVAARAIEEIKKLIEAMGLRPGMKLPPERGLTSQFGVGRPAVREAIKALCMLEVLDSRHGSGTYVKSLTAFPTTWLFGTERVGENLDLLGLVEVRKTFERRASGLAAARVTDRQPREMERLLHLQESSLDDLRAYEQADYSFHDVIFRAAGNHILDEIVRMLAPLLFQSRQVTARTTATLIKIGHEHRTIYEAIRRGQSELAERAMMDHLQSVGLDPISPFRR